MSGWLCGSRDDAGERGSLGRGRVASVPLAVVAVLGAGSTNGRAGAGLLGNFAHPGPAVDAALGAVAAVVRAGDARRGNAAGLQAPAWQSSVPGPQRLLQLGSGQEPYRRTTSRGGIPLSRCRRRCCNPGSALLQALGKRRARAAAERARASKHGLGDTGEAYGALRPGQGTASGTLAVVSDAFVAATGS